MNREETKPTRCPCCKAALEVKISQDSERRLVPHLEATRELENILLQNLLAFWRCRGEDNRKYQSEQYYYNPYHNHIEYDKEKDTYSFCIQTYDSPEGDTWLQGIFKLRPGCGGPVVEVIETTTSSSAFSEGE